MGVTAKGPVLYPPQNLVITLEPSSMQQAMTWGIDPMLLNPVHQYRDFILATRPTRLNLDHEHTAVLQKRSAQLYGDISYLLDRLPTRNKSCVLLIFQGMDASGKDGSIRTLMSQLPQPNLRLSRFVQPTIEESNHDFLWRVHRQTPSVGEIVLFNRSHYEEALVQRVRNGVSAHSIRKITQHIIHFEELLADQGTIILKFFLHISKKTQYERFKSRIQDPGRSWKLTDLDLEDRKRWCFFMRTYQGLMRSTSNKSAPWFVIPADDKSIRDLCIAQLVWTVLKTLR